MEEGVIHYMITISRGAALQSSLTREEEKEFSEYFLLILMDIFHAAMAHSFVQTTFVLTVIL